MNPINPKKRPAPNLKVICRPIRTIALVVAMLASIMACKQPAENTAKCFVIGYLDITASAPLFIAEHDNIFDEYDICVETVQFASSNQLIDAIAGGRIDYVVEVSAVPALALQLRDPGRFFITAASTISEEQPFDAILVRSDSVIETLADLEGKRIGVFPGTTATSMLQEFLQNQQIDTSQIAFIPTAPPNMLAALKSKAVDAIHAYEPTWTIGLYDDEIEQLSGTVYGRQLAPNPQGISVLRRQAYEERQSEARKLVQVFDRALEIMDRQPKMARDALRSHFDLPGTTVDDMHLLYMASHDEINWDSLDRYAELLVKVGELDSKPLIDGLRLPAE